MMAVVAGELDFDIRAIPKPLLLAVPHYGADPGAAVGVTVAQAADVIAERLSRGGTLRFGMVAGRDLRGLSISGDTLDPGGYGRGRAALMIRLARALTGVSGFVARRHALLVKVCVGAICVGFAGSLIGVGYTISQSLPPDVLAALGRPIEFLSLLNANGDQLISEVMRGAPLPAPPSPLELVAAAARTVERGVGSGLDPTPVARVFAAALDLVLTGVVAVALSDRFDRVHGPDGDGALPPRISSFARQIDPAPGTSGTGISF